MTTLAWHVTMRLQDGRVLCRNAAERRRAARVLLEKGDAHGLLVGRVADTHVHALLACERRAAGVFAHAVETALGWRLDLPQGFEPARFIPTKDQAHLARGFFYIGRQEQRHGTAVDPFHDACTWPDLVGARVLLPPSGLGEPLGGRMRELVASMLPRVRRRELLRELGISTEPPALHVGDLADASAAAFGLDAITGRGPTRTRARAAAIRLSSGLWRPGEVAERLALTRRAVELLRDADPDLPGVRAVALQLHMRAAYRAAPLHDAPLAPAG